MLEVLPAKEGLEKSALSKTVELEKPGLLPSGVARLIVDPVTPETVTGEPARRSPFALLGLARTHATSAAVLSPVPQLASTTAQCPLAPKQALALKLPPTVRVTVPESVAAGEPFPPPVRLAPEALAANDALVKSAESKVHDELSE
jgi:hypothetical protein